MRKGAFLLWLGMHGFCFSQMADSTKVTKLEEVVVTGQISPQSVQQAVNRVKVIHAEQFTQLAAQHLGDVLNQQLNLTIVPNSGSGRSTASLLGLDGQYVKILIDNIPVVSDTGLGNNVDVTQISLHDIERIEIIEGSMGVTHGANAVSGIINIITKKKAKNTWEIMAFAQEETVGAEYRPFDQGRHIQTLRIAHQALPNLFISAQSTRNDFGGFQGDRAGKFHLQNDGNRGKLWLPKTQLTHQGLISYKWNQIQSFYKIEHFSESIDFYNNAVNQEFVPGIGILRFGNDRVFDVKRNYHHWNVSGNFGLRSFTNSFSFQSQSRGVEDFRYFIQTGEKDNKRSETFQSTEILYGTGTFSNVFASEKIPIQLGYEWVDESGFASANTGFFRDADQQRSDLNRRLAHFDVFSIAEWNAGKTTKIRPGARYSFQNIFENQYAVTLGVRQELPRDWELRSALGRSYRTPNFEELYTYFVDSNHHLVGNENLSPEQSYSVDMHAKKSFSMGKWKTQQTFAMQWIDVRDRISVALVRTAPRWEFEYINIDQFLMANATWQQSWKREQFSANIGVSYLGISQSINTGEVSSPNDFLWTLQANIQLNYTWKKHWQTSLFWKYNGRQQQFVETRNEQNQAVFALSEIHPFSWLDFTIERRFFDNRLHIMAGARNILDVVDVQTQRPASGGTHATAPGGLLLGYGRSYLLRLTYQLNFK